VVYTGTHDNDTTLSWYWQRTEEDKAMANDYLDISGEALEAGRTDIVWKMIRAALGSVSDTAIIPMQDYLEKGGEARINTPSTLGNNWKWRMVKEACTDKLAEKIKDLCELYGR